MYSGTLVVCKQVVLSCPLVEVFCCVCIGIHPGGGGVCIGIHPGGGCMHRYTPGGGGVCIGMHPGGGVCIGIHPGGVYA